MNAFPHLRIILYSLYTLEKYFFQYKFKPKSSYVPVDYAYVHSERSKVGVTGVFLWEDYSKKNKNGGEKSCSYDVLGTQEDMERF